MDCLMDALFNLSLQVRYVAVYRHGELSLRQRPHLSLPPLPSPTATRSCSSTPRS